MEINEDIYNWLVGAQLIPKTGKRMEENESR